MTDELKYWHIVEAVRLRGPAEKAARAVLGIMARYADREGVTFVGQKRVADETGFSLSAVKRACAALEFAGWIRVEERRVRVETARGFERKGNQYRIDLVKLGLVVERAQGSGPRVQNGIACSSTPLARPKQEITGVEGMGPAGRYETNSLRSTKWSDQRDEGEFPALEVERGDEGARPIVKKHIGWSRDEGERPAEKAEEKFSARSHFDGDEVSNEARRGVKRGPPLNKKNKQEKPEHATPPYAPPRYSGQVEIAECGEPAALQRSPKHPQRLANESRVSGRHCMEREAFGAQKKGDVIVFPHHVMERAKTRSQSARSASALRGQLYASVRETLDGEEAALWDEMERVLRACGVDPETSGRKTRQAVMGALRVAVREFQVSIAEAAEVAIRNHGEYRRLGHMLLSPMGVTAFFRSGECWNPSLWRLYGQGR